MTRLKNILKNKKLLVLGTSIIVIVVMLIIYKQSIDSKYKYKLIKDGISITNCISKGDETLRVPSHIWGKKVIILDDYAFSYMGYKEIFIPDTVESIGSKCFYGSSDLETLEGMKNVKSIGCNAFENCSNLRKFACPDVLMDLGESAFSKCVSLEKVTVNNTLRSIERNTFSDCRSLRKVILGKNIEVIKENAFLCCISMESLSLESKEVEILSSAFALCMNLEKFDFKGSMHINSGINPFTSCFKLEGANVGGHIISSEKKTL